MPQEWDEKEARQISCEKLIFGGKELGGRFQWESGTVKETSKGIPGCSRMLLTILILLRDYVADDKVNMMMKRMRRSRGQGRHRQGRQFTFSASDSPPPAAAGPLLGTALARYMY